MRPWQMMWSNQIAHAKQVIGCSKSGNNQRTGGSVQALFLGLTMSIELDYPRMPS